MHKLGIQFHQYQNDFLENWDKTYRTGVPFYCDNPRPEKFELTGFYPLYSDEEIL